MTKPPVHSLSSCAGCGCTGEDFYSANVEAFEMTGALYCDECADDVFERAAAEEAYEGLSCRLPDEGGERG